MVAVYLSPIYILFNIYVARWLIKWMSACSKHFKKKWIRVVIVVIYTFLALAMLIGFLLPVGKPQRFMKLIGNYWLGVMLYVLLTIIIADILRMILRRIKRINQDKLRSKRTFVLVGGVCATVITVISLLGALNARIVRTTEYNISIEKNAEELKDLRVVLVADLHLGYNIGCRHMQRMVDQINKQDADLVVMAGDIFDNEYEALDNPEELAKILKTIKSKYGVYAVYGNHDIEEKILAGFTFADKTKKKMSDIRMDELLAAADVTLLRDEAVLIADSVYLYGRPDASKLGRGITKRKTPEEITKDLDKTKPIIVLDHQPSQLEELSEAGVDLDLSGHTHDGQLFPGNITTKLMWENSYGYLKKGNMQSIVTSGVGLFGPNMRVGTKAEICSIQVKFNE